MAQVEFSEVTKEFAGGVRAVENLNLRIDDGEFVVFVGPSGCGKTTALRMTAGLEAISEGTISIGDRVVNDVPSSKRDIAMVFQNYALYPHMSVFENMAFGLQQQRLSKREIERRVRGIADLLELDQYLSRKPRALSGGQRQRVAMGRAIVREPAVFLMDEPLSNLDAKLRVQTRAEIARLHQRLKTTVVYVTHDQVEAMTMGDRIAVMNDGRLEQVATPEEVYDRPANRFVAGFIGSPAMNFVRVTLEWTEHALWAHAPGIRVRVPPARTETLRQHTGKTVILGLRPEALHPAGGADAADFAFDATVEVVEPLGSEILLDMRVGESPMVARVDPGLRVSAHERVRIAFDPAKLHFFDAATEASI